MSHTYAILEVTQATYDEIRRKLEHACYWHCFHQDEGREVIDMHGVAVARWRPIKREGLKARMKA